MRVKWNVNNLKFKTEVQELKLFVYFPCVCICFLVKYFTLLSLFLRKRKKHKENRRVKHVNHTWSIFKGLWTLIRYQLSISRNGMISNTLKIPFKYNIFIFVHFSIRQRSHTLSLISFECVSYAYSLILLFPTLPNLNSPLLWGCL